MSEQRNVLGGSLEACCYDPVTGFYRDGFCHVGAEDFGIHAVCAVVTQTFLEYSRAQGNDLMTGHPALGFPGLEPGDQWCLCASRWLEAYEAGCAPRVCVRATSEAALEVISLETLKHYAIDLS